MPSSEHVNTSMLRVSRAVAIRAAEWGAHKLGGPTALAAEIACLVASCMVITQVMLQWFRQRRMSRPQTESVLSLIPESDADRRERQNLVEFSIARGTKAGIPRDEAERCARYVLQVLSVNDLEEADTTQAAAEAREQQDPADG